MMRTKVSIKEINKMVMENNFSNHQAACLMSGAKHGLSMEQISMYAKPCFNGWQMAEIMNGFYNLTIDQVALYAKPQFNCEEMHMIRVGLIDGLSMEEIINANPALCA